MDLEIKTEQQTAKCCVACLREDVDLIGEDSIVSETTAVYKKLVSEEVFQASFVFQFFYSSFLY